MGSAKENMEFAKDSRKKHFLFAKNGRLQIVCACVWICVDHCWADGPMALNNFFQRHTTLSPSSAAWHGCSTHRLTPREVKFEETPYAASNLTGLNWKILGLLSV